MTGPGVGIGRNEAAERQEQVLNHSSLMPGRAVKAAGHVEVAGGKAVGLTDDSGHFAPDSAHTYSAFSSLAEQGVLDPQSQTGRVGLVDKTQQKGRTQRDMASVHFSGYEQAQGDEAAIRTRIALREEIADRAALAQAPAPIKQSGAGAGAASATGAASAGPARTAPSAAAGYDVSGNSEDTAAGAAPAEEPWWQRHLPPETRQRTDPATMARYGMSESKRFRG